MYAKFQAEGVDTGQTVWQTDIQTDRITHTLSYAACKPAA